MNPKILVSVFTMVGLLAGAAAAAKPKSAGASSKPQVLTAGKYTAKAKPFVCGGCGPLIRETLQKNPGIDSVAVDDKEATVQFTVKKGAKVNVSELQKELKTSSDKMGMGADYQLKEIKKAS